MPRTINWPTREEWAAKAEHATRTQCYTWQRVSADPADWLTTDELDEARALAVAVVKATRTALTRAGRGNERSTLNAHGREAACDWAEVNDLSYAWGHIVSIAQSVQAVPEQTDRLAALGGQMVQRRDEAAKAAEEMAVADAIASRKTDAGWAKELERRARIERGPMVTTTTVHADGSTTTTGPVPYNPPFPV